MTASGASAADAPVLRVHAPSRLAFAGTTLALVTLASLSTAALISTTTSVPPATTSPGLTALPPEVSDGGGLVVDRAPGTFRLPRPVVAPKLLQALAGGLQGPDAVARVVGVGPALPQDVLFPAVLTPPVAVPAVAVPVRSVPVGTVPVGTGSVGSDPVVAPVVAPVIAPAVLPVVLPVVGGRHPRVPHRTPVLGPSVVPGTLTGEVDRAVQQLEKAARRAGHKHQDPKAAKRGDVGRDDSGIVDLRLHERARHAQQAERARSHHAPRPHAHAGAHGTAEQQHVKPHHAKSHHAKPHHAKQQHAKPQHAKHR